MKFFVGDWLQCPELNTCSLEAQGLWMRMICLMHQAEPYGQLLVSGEPVDTETLALLVGKPLAVVERALGELERRKVFSRTPGSVIFSRRMAQDEETRGARSVAGSAGASRTNAAAAKLRESAAAKSRKFAAAQRSEIRDQKSESEPKARGQKKNAPAAPTLPRKPATGPHAEVIQHWEAEWKRTRLGTTYTIQAKDGSAVAKMLALSGVDATEVKLRMTRLLQSDDAFWAKNAEPSLLLSKWNHFAVEVRTPSPTGKADPMQSWGAQELARRRAAGDA